MDSSADSTSQHAEFAARLEDEERRRWTRIPGERTCIVPLGVATEPNLMGVVEDVSLAGAAVSVPDASKFAIGQEVQVGFPEGNLPALIKYIEPLDDGLHRLGMEWTGVTSTKIAAILKGFLE
jgi:hypothetical protein